MRLLGTYFFLSALHIADVPVFVQVCPDLFRVCCPGYTEIWSLQGRLVGFEADFEVQSMGRKWL